MSELTREAVQRAVDEIEAAHRLVVSGERALAQGAGVLILNSLASAREGLCKAVDTHADLLLATARRALDQREASDDELARLVVTRGAHAVYDGGFRAGFQAGAASRLLLPPAAAEGEEEER